MLFVKVIGGPGACSGPCANQRALTASDQAAGARTYCSADTYPLGGFAFPGLGIVPAMAANRAVTRSRQAAQKKEHYEYD